MQSRFTSAFPFQARFRLSGETEDGLDGACKPAEKASRTRRFVSVLSQLDVMLYDQLSASFPFSRNVSQRRRRIAKLVFAPRVGFVFQQYLHNIRSAVDCGCHQCRVPCIILGIDPCARVKQCLSHLHCLRLRKKGRTENVGCVFQKQFDNTQLFRFLNRVLLGWLANCMHHCRPYRASNFEVLADCEFLLQILLDCLHVIVDNGFAQLHVFVACLCVRVWCVPGYVFTFWVRMSFLHFSTSGLVLMPTSKATLPATSLALAFAQRASKTFTTSVRPRQVAQMSAVEPSSAKTE